MEWHAGNTPAQTILTILHLHRIQDLDPDTSFGFQPFAEPDRPIELLTVVLRASLLGLLKCCDLSWRELNKERVYDVTPFVLLDGCLT